MEQQLVESRWRLIIKCKNSLSVPSMRSVRRVRVLHNPEQLCIESFWANDSVLNKARAAKHPLVINGSTSDLGATAYDKVQRPASS